MGNLIGTTFSFAITGALFILYGAALWGVHKRLLKAYADKPAEQYRRQLIWLGLALFGLVFVITVIPIGDAMQGQLLSLLGIVLSATIALSSTTIVGNAMAGLMLKSLKKIRPGNYIKVQEHAGRVSEMDLLHTEIQTEDRDLTTLPNLYLVTHPVRVLRKSGTILSVEVSLGYDVSRRRVEELLLAAAEKAGLKDPFVQIRHLGDFSVVYRIAGLCEDVEQLLANRRRLRAATLDELHNGDIEIVSPNFMNTRAVADGARIIPPVDETPLRDADVTPDAVVFDKAQQAESLENLREQREALGVEIEELETQIKAFKDPESAECRAAEKTLNTVRKRVEMADARIAAAEERISDG
ncbi:MAG: mechanosensitive ion channel domain-containing protein [Gammaproteobacteria bacterium]